MKPPGFRFQASVGLNVGLNDGDSVGLSVEALELLLLASILTLLLLIFVGFTTTHLLAFTTTTAFFVTLATTALFFTLTTHLDTFPTLLLTLATGQCRFRRGGCTRNSR